MIATTGLPSVAWDVLIAVIVLFGVVAAPVLAVTENRRPEPLRPLGDWADDVHVHIPGINNLPAKRRAPGCGPERLKAGDISWMFRPDPRPAFYSPQPAEPRPPARLTPRRVALPAPRPSGVPALPAFLWPNPGPAEPTQPVRTVYVAPVGDRRRVHVPAPLEVAS